MNKRFIPIISIFMTVSALVFIYMQIFWLNKSIKFGELNFSTKVEEALAEASKQVNIDEVNRFYAQFNNFYETIQAKQDSGTLQTAISIIDSSSVKYVIYKKTLVMNTPLLIPYTQKDSIKITNLLSDEGVLQIRKDPNEKDIQPLNKELERDINSSRFTLTEFARLNISQIPISKRVSPGYLSQIIHQELSKQHINNEFKVGILDDEFKATNVKDDGFNYDSNRKNYTELLFTGSNNQTQYYLAIYFPNKGFALLDSISGPLTITIISTLIIIIIYIVSIYFMYNQKKIAEIKTDFLNNMSHEFKTPIATISIAADALNSPKVQQDPDKIKKYTTLIKQANSRMIQQVEIVLKMSKLESNEIILEKKEVNLSDLLNECVESISTQVKEREGTIGVENSSERKEVEVDPFLFSTAILNILDNANKYSINAPHINVNVYDEGEYLCISIKDQGKGMKKEVLNKIFEKFYREESGNIHNVKGHGLGLSYVKKIISLHKGLIEVKSKINKGTQFIVKIP